MQKLALDRYARLYHEHYGLETVALRYFNVYGPRQQGGAYSGVISTFLDQVDAGDSLTIHGDGEQTRDFVHVDDVVQANLLAATSERDGRAYNVGTGRETTITALAERIRDLADAEVDIVNEAPRPGDVRHCSADCSRAKRELRYEPSIELESGLRSLVRARAAGRVATGSQ